MHRRAAKAELLAQPTLQEAHVPRFQLPCGEQHECGWTDLRLGAEQNPRLLTATHRMWMCRNNPAQERVQPSG
jgi:hypothetical protein